MDGYSDYSAGSAQHTWVLADLGAVDRSKTPWLVVAFHQPYYNSNTAHAGEGAALAGIYETPFFSAGVDVCFSGHVHGKLLAGMQLVGRVGSLGSIRGTSIWALLAYERSFRTYLNESNAAAPYYITIGDGGYVCGRERCARDVLGLVFHALTSSPSDRTQEPRGPCSHVDLPATCLVGFPPGLVRPRRARGGQCDAHALDLAPEPGRERGAQSMHTCG